MCDAEVAVHQACTCVLNGLCLQLVSKQQKLSVCTCTRGVPAPLTHVQVRQQVQQLREAQVDLAALREELQQLQSAHDEARAHVAELRDKVGQPMSCRPAHQRLCL
jgi:cell division protein FtsB